MTLAVPPYDVIIFCVLLAIGWVGLAVFIACRSRRRGAPAIATPELGEAPQAKESVDGETPPQEQQSAAKGEVLSSKLAPAPVVVCGFAIVVIAYLLTVIIFAILAATGTASSLLFSPITNNSCGAACTFYAKDGLSGWVDENCCTYTNSSLLSGQDVWLAYDPIEQGKKVHGWLFRNTTRSYAGQPRRSLFWAHGSGNNVGAGYRWSRYEYFLGLGNIDVFIFDYPGYGKSPVVGKGSDIGSEVVKATEGAAAWFSAWVNGTVVVGFGSEHFPAAAPTAARMDLSQITLLGRSLGGCPVVRLGRSVQWRIKGLMLQSAFSSVYDLSVAYFPLAGWALGSWAAKHFPDFNVYGGLDDIPGSTCVYHSHSRSDEWVPFQEARKLQRRLTSNVNNSVSGCDDVFLQLNGVLHTQPLTTAERQLIAGWLSSQ